MIDFLNILKNIVLHNIMLIGDIILFSVSTNTKRWRFRVDDIGYFYYTETENQHLYSQLVINAIDKLLLIIKDQYIFDVFLNIKHLIEQLKNNKIEDYLEVLIKIIRNDVVILEKTAEVIILY